jgi:eukaryotic-like serine/threonine-protein kinase
MSPTVTTASRSPNRLRAFIARFPFLSIAITGFLLGYAVIAAWLLPGAFAKSESAVPNVVGLQYSDASARLNAAGFKVKAGDNIYHPTAPKGSVLGQTPAPGVKGLKGNEVTLDVSLGAKKGTVPDVVGMLRDAATKAIESAGFDVATDVTEILNAKPRGEVLGTTPKVGSTVLQPSTVRLSVSAGPDAIGVPSLIGMPVEEALALIGQLGLTAGSTRTDSTSTQPEGFVTAQRPSANTPVAPGATVTLTVSRPRAPRDSVAP